MNLAKEARALANEPIVTGPEGRKMLRAMADELDRYAALVERYETALRNLRIDPAIYALPSTE
jgi:hypothetical protein